MRLQLSFALHKTLLDASGPGADLLLTLNLVKGRWADPGVGRSGTLRGDVEMEHSVDVKLSGSSDLEVAKLAKEVRGGQNIIDPRFELRIVGSS
eukprot:905518-Alexandrium_andersonii.AAC.1